jgi:hypothetical protein
MVLVFALICLKAVRFRGDWSESSRRDEAVALFEEINPPFAAPVQNLLRDVPDDSGSILSALRGKIPDHILGLVNLSLSLRFFHPKCAVRNPQPGSPFLHGWSIEGPGPTFSVHDIKTIHYKLISALARVPAESQFRLTRSAAVDLGQIHGTINGTDVIQEIVDGLKSISVDARLSTINGRWTNTDPFHILDSLIQEYKLSKCYDYSRATLHSRAWRQTYHWTEPPPDAPKLESHDWWRIYQSWPENPEMSRVESWSFLATRKQLASVHIFFTIRSPESAALLEWAEEIALENRPIHLYMCLVADLNNKTEKHIAYSWIQSVDYLGTRNACVFMIDGFKRGFKSAYGATLPSVSWRNLMKEVPNSTLEARFLTLQKWAKDRQIDDVAVMVNGEFIQERPIFQSVQNKALGVARRLQDATKEGEIANWSETDIKSWYTQHAFEYNRAVYPLRISFKNYLTIASLPMDVLSGIADKLASVAVPTLLKVPLISHDRLLQLSLTDDERRFLRLSGSEPVTIVGNLIFKSILHDTELDYAVRCVHFTFCVDNLEESLSTKQLLLSLFLRSTMALEGIRRGEPPIIGRSRLPIIEIHPTLPVVWRIVADPLAPEMRPVFDFVGHVVDAAAARVVLTPAIRAAEYAEVPAHFEKRFHLTVTSEPANVPDSFDMGQVHAPFNWQFRRSDNIVHKLIGFGFSDSIDLMKIGEAWKAPLQENGYFQVMLPVGRYSMIGAVEREFFVDSFVPHPVFYRADGSKMAMDIDPTINVLTFMIDNSWLDTTKAMLYLAESNTTSRVKLWLVEDSNTVSFQNVSYEILPNYWPYYMVKPSETLLQWKSWKFALAEVYLPANAQVIFLDHSVLFRGDLSRFHRIDMQNAVAAAPVLTASWWHQRNQPWMQRNARRLRMDRPCHTVDLVFFRIDAWRREAGPLFRRMLAEKELGNQVMGLVDADLFNILQLRVQVMSLPEDVAYCCDRSPEKLARTAVGVILCTGESARRSGIRLEKLKKMALARYG